MLEKDIENLLSKYPNDFFPTSNLVLKGQQVRLGSCYADILFEDKHGRAIIVEVKRGILSRDASGQIIEYYGLLKQSNPNKIIELILCANAIPAERKLFLEQVGIECKELGVALLTNVALKYGYQFLDEQQPCAVSKEIGGPGSAQSITLVPKVAGGWIFQANPLKYDVLNALSALSTGESVKCWQVNQHAADIHAGQLGFIWMSGKESGIYAVAEILTDPAVMKAPPEDDKFWVDDAKKNESRMRVRLSIKKTFLNQPIFRDQIKRTPGLEKMSILNFSQGTNFPVSKNECELLLKMTGICFSASK